MFKQRLQSLVEKAFQKASKDGAFAQFEHCPEPILIETPKLAEHGDLACGVALKLARHLKAPPVKIAGILADYIEKENVNGGISNLEVANPGFINFRVGTAWLGEALQLVHQESENYGRAEIGAGKRVNVEYVSANPTGELHIGHGRGAVLGSCLAHLFQFAGYRVEQEFLVNDAGEQINQLANCAWAAYQRKMGDSVDYPDSGYPEESIADYINRITEAQGSKFLEQDAEVSTEELGNLVKEMIRKDQEELLERLGVSFEHWFSEKTLHQTGKLEAALGKLKQSNYTYEAEGALWLKAKELGDERDRVLRKSSGAYTYLAGDAAYHLDKFERGYDLMINIWGADHHGQVPGLKAVVRALGEDASKLEVILTQIVNLNRAGEIVRMSKRRGTVVTLQEVMDEVGVDATRYYLAESNPQNSINFDLELAKQTSSENRVYYIQYAHARCSSILRRAQEEILDPTSGEKQPPVLSEAGFQELEHACRQDPTLFEPGFTESENNFVHQKALTLRLAAFPDEVEEAARTWQPGKIARFASELANDTHKFIETSRVLSDELSVTRARLGLIMATRQVLANSLAIIGVSAPERM